MLVGESFIAKWSSTAIIRHSTCVLDRQFVHIPCCSFRLLEEKFSIRTRPVFVIVLRRTLSINSPQPPTTTAQLVNVCRHTASLTSTTTRALLSRPTCALLCLRITNRNTGAAGSGGVALEFAEEDGQYFNGGLKTEAVSALPPCEAGDADAGAELAGEVEVPEDLFVEG
jgi:hypothetical protein